MNPSLGAPQRVHLIDSSLYVFRAWHALPDEFHDVDEAPVNAVYGFTRFLADLLERARPSHVAAAFDLSLKSCFRNALYPAYKANRDPAPPELHRQFEYCRDMAQALGIPVLADPTYEADDLIGSALHCLRAHGFTGIIISADKDFGQLLGEHDEQWDFSRGQRWGAAGVHARLGVQPNQVADYLALTGDAVDNIPGVPGIGAKTAAALLEHFGNLETLYARLDELPFLRLRGAARAARALREHAEQALLARQLTTIALNAPVIAAPEELRWHGPDLRTLEMLIERLRFGAITRARLRALAGA